MTWQDLYHNNLINPRRDGRILMGSTLEDVGFNNETTDSAAKELHEKAIAMLPALANAEIEVHWSGLRPGSPEGVPFIGRHPGIEGLFLCTGHFRNGFVLGPASAKLASNLVLGDEPIVDLEPYKISGIG